MEARNEHNPEVANTVTYLKKIAEAGFEDVHTLRRDTAEQVLTEERMRLIKEIATGDVESVRDLARRTGRNVSIVSRDLKTLVEADVVEYEKVGNMKKPVLAHENIFVKPVVCDGGVLAESTLDE